MVLSFVVRHGSGAWCIVVYYCVRLCCSEWWSEMNHDKYSELLTPYLLQYFQLSMTILFKREVSRHLSLTFD